MNDMDFEVESELCLNCGSESAHELINKENTYQCDHCNVVYQVEDYEMEILKGKKRDWLKYLTANLEFSFEAEVTDDDADLFGRGGGPIKQGDLLKVIKLVEDEPDYGVLAEVKFGTKKYIYPMCDLSAVDESSPNYIVLDDYQVWFANCR